MGGNSPLKHNDDFTSLPCDMDMFMLSDNNLDDKSVSLSSFSAINQLDGNQSFISNSSFDNLDLPSHIPTYIGLRLKKMALQRPPPVRKVIRRDNRCMQSEGLPKFSVYNMRSLMPKVKSLAADMSDRECSVSFLSEVWEKFGSKKHKAKIEELFELNGLKYISTPRARMKRGGGAAIIADTSSYHLSKLNVTIPRKLEIVWGLLQPVKNDCKIKKVILCSFYCPPRSRKKSDLIEHITLTLHLLKLEHQDAHIIIAGDKNDLQMNKLTGIDSSIKQMISQPTRGTNTLDVVLTDLHRFYSEPDIVNPISVDISGKGVPSDHFGIVLAPRRNSDAAVNKQKIMKVIQPISQTSIQNIGQVFCAEEWSFMNPDLSSTQLTSLFEYYVGNIVDLHCPKKTITVRSDDNPFITEALKGMKRRIMREYEKRGKSQKYLELKELFSQKLNDQKVKYKDKILQSVIDGDRSSSYKALRKLGVRPGESSSTSFQLPSLNNVSDSVAAEVIADHFASISNEYEALDVEKLPHRVKEVIQQNESSSPRLTDYEVYMKLRRAKKPLSTVPGDLPQKILKEFICELTSPITTIYNSILLTCEYPRQWVIEYQVPIPKVVPPTKLDDLRNIAKTSFISKVFESFLADWLMPVVKPFLDPCQYGLKGTSTSHYLIKLLQFIHEHIDLGNPHAVVLALVDLSKAFNRVSHSMVIEDLCDMKVPSWLLKILVSYLSKRSMVLTFKGAISSAKPLPGSSPQGAFLGIFLFIVKFNGAALRPSIPRILGTCRNTLRKCVLPDCHRHRKDFHALYIDDLAEAEAVNLKKQLVIDPNFRPAPLTFHERTRQVLPENTSVLQSNLIKIKTFTDNNLQKINESKSKIMLFNKSKRYTFPPEFSFGNGVLLEVIEKTKLLGVIIHSNLTWKENTENMVRKAMSKLWLLRRMKLAGLENRIIFDYFIKEIRPIVEYAAPVWNSGISKLQSSDIEKVQKVAMRIILQQSYKSYTNACEIFETETLSSRRESLCTKFAIKLYKSDRRWQFFDKPLNLKNTRYIPLVQEHHSRSKRCYDAAHNSLARIVNLNAHKIKS